MLVKNPSFSNPIFPESTGPRAAGIEPSLYRLQEEEERRGRGRKREEEDGYESCLFKKLIYSLQEKSKLETDNSVSNPSGYGIPDGLETEFSVFKTLVSNCVRLNSVSDQRPN